MQTHEERFQHLERQLEQTNRRLLVTGAILGAVLLGIGVVAWTVPENRIDRASQKVVEADTLRTHHLVLEGAGGIRRVRLTTTPDSGSELMLFDEHGNPRALLASYKAGPILMLFGENGETRGIFGQAEEVGTRLKIYDRAGTARATVGAVGTKTSDGREISYPESTVLLYDAEGAVTWSAPR